jgi:hypothetical protein
MGNDPADVITDTRVGVVWRGDIDPHATSPLWASVRFIPANAPATNPSRPLKLSGVVIEISATPPNKRWTDREDWRFDRYRPAARGAGE